LSEFDFIKLSGAYNRCCDWRNQRGFAKLRQSNSINYRAVVDEHYDTINAVGFNHNHDDNNS